MKPYSKEAQMAATPEVALADLKEGNERFVTGNMKRRDMLTHLDATREDQYPLSVILSCIDSRLSPVHIFDQGFGQVFGIRMAGSVIDEDVLGSFEYACKLGGAKLMVVLGHSKCNAIHAACDNIQSGNLSTLLNKIQTSIYYERTVKENRNSENAEFVEKVSKVHVHRCVAMVINQSLVLREMIEKNEVGVIGAYYDVDTGRVEFLEDTYVIGDISAFAADS